LGAAADLPKAKLIGKIKTPFGKAELEVFRQMLLDKRRALVGDMNGIEAEALRTNRQEGSGDLSNMPTHPADIGTDNFEQEFTLGLLESERTLLAEINGALERIDNNTYGVCLGTGQPIGAARLKARPWSKYCIEYAKLLEKGLVQPKEESSENQDEEAPAPSSDEAPEEEEEFVEEEPEE
jgi:RNA polymerase-binding protein DksA